MAGKSLDIEITKDGISIDANGFKGTDCEAELKSIEAELEELGIHTERKERKVKAEMYIAAGSRSSGQRI